MTEQFKRIVGNALEPFYEHLDQMETYITQ